MKRKEMAESPSRLTWDGVIELLRANGDEGMSNKEIAETFETDYARVRGLTLVMFEAGALSRVQIGDVGGAAFFFLPVQEVAEHEHRSAAV
ncbi:hypothetical protein ACGYQ5_14430 [Burkholderia pseudomallei]